MFRVLCVGGLDPSGGAGITADTRMVHRQGGVPLAVPVCLTAQTRRDFRELMPVPHADLRAMLAAACDDGPIDAIKLGLLGDREAVAVIVELLERQVARHVIVDPVLSASAPGWSAPEELAECYRREILPLSSVVTPNLPELELLAPDGASRLVAEGCDVLVTGGHGGESMIEDRLWTSEGEVVFRHERLPVGEVHGTGCALASALASELARGTALEESCRLAVAVLVECLRQTRGEGDEPWPLAIS